MRGSKKYRIVQYGSELFFAQRKHWWGEWRTVTHIAADPISRYDVEPCDGRTYDECLLKLINWEGPAARYRASQATYPIIHEVPADIFTPVDPRD